MNNNIRELRKQATETYTYSDCDGDNNRGVRLNEEKFAELIIKECLSVFHRMDNGNKVCGYDEIEYYPNAVVKHFGVN